jgi:MFS family permease
MTTATTAALPAVRAPDTELSRAAARQPWLAALAVVPILFTVFQTLVLTDVTSDVIRLGINADQYQMIWSSMCWGVCMAYGVFIGLWSLSRFGMRDTLLVGLVWFALGNVLCGAATDVTSMSVAKIVEGLGKGLVIVVCRSLLYRQFNRMVMVAIGIYGVLAYATRPTTPLVTAWINSAVGWRWIFWVNVPVALLAFPLVRRFIAPDRPPRAAALRIDWFAATLFVGWAVSLLFMANWYRKWGGWSSNAFTATAVCAIGLPFIFTGWLAAGFSVSEHITRIFRVRLYLLAMIVRVLLLFQLLAVLVLVGKYCLTVREYPRDVTGWIMAPASVTMATTTFLTTWFRRRSLRHVWLLVAVIGCAACLWWLSSVDAFTSKQRIAFLVGTWGLFVGLIPPVFLQDEVDGLEPRDFLYGGSFACVFLAVPLVLVPAMTNTAVAAWTDRSVDAQRLNIQQNRPEVETATARVAEYYGQRGLDPAEAGQTASTELASFVRSEAMARGIQHGFQFLALTVSTTGLIAVALLAGGKVPRRAAG